MSSNPSQVPPTGFQLLYANETYKSELDSSPFNQIILPIHWSIIRTPAPHNFRLINGQEILSESLPDDWQAGSVKKGEGEEGRRYIELYYKDVSGTGEVIRVKVEDVGSGNVAVHVKGDGDGGGGGRGGIVEVGDYLVGGGSGELSSVGSVYKVAELWGLEKVVQGIVTGKGESPYSTTLLPKDEKKKLRSADDDEDRQEFQSLRQPARGLAGPLVDPFGDLGRSDLDPFHNQPFGPGVAGGMLMDPRGFRRPQLPQGILPGSRFDPVGPLGGGIGPRRRGAGGGGGPRLPYAFPDPDNERVSVFEDMFM